MRSALWFGWMLLAAAPAAAGECRIVRAEAFYEPKAAMPYQFKYALMKQDAETKYAQPGFASSTRASAYA